MAGLTNYQEQQILNDIFRTTARTRTAALYVGLYTTMPTADDGTGGTEVSGNAYARQSVSQADASWKDPSSATQGQTNNVSAITFPAATPAGWGTVIGVGIFDASTSGNTIFFQPLIRSGDSIYLATAIASTDVFTAPGSAYSNGDTVRVLAVDAAVGGSSIPTGITADTLYYVVSVSGNTFKLSLTSGGAAVDVTADGACYVYREGSKVIGIGDVFSFPAAKLVVGLA